MGRTPPTFFPPPLVFSGFNASESLHHIKGFFLLGTGLEGPLSGRPPTPPSRFKEDGARPRVSVFPPFFSVRDTVFPGSNCSRIRPGGKVG